MRRIGIVLVVLAASLALTSTATAAGGRTLVTQLTGPVEVPPGDPDGTGTASITVNPGLSQVCWEIAVQNITLPAAAAHIHNAPAGQNGGVKVDTGLKADSAIALTSGGTTIDKSSITVDAALAQDIVDNPANYYVNVHSTVHSGGVVRGQLVKK